LRPRATPTAASKPSSAPVEKAKFLQDVGFSQMVQARDLTLEQIREINATK
jgi:23S rRNA 5-hydroxycytidine C2501 synthase